MLDSSLLPLHPLFRSVIDSLVFTLAVSSLSLSLFQRESKGKLSVCSKVCYAIGGAPYQITGCALGFFLQIYLLDVAQVSQMFAYAGKKGKSICGCMLMKSVCREAGFVLDLDSLLSNASVLFFVLGFPRIFLN